MYLYHATPAYNVNGIRRHGLLAKLAQGRRRCVWLHACSESLWALQHVAKRHNTRPSDCVVFRVQVDPCDVKKGPRKGLYYVMGDVPVDPVSNLKTAHEVLDGPETW